jgi:CheY-like chemotaxis protein
MDDDPIVLELARAALTRAGCRVSAARHGEEALSYHAQGLADGQPFDLVVLDVTIIGGLGGEATIERLRAVDPHVRAIVSSGYSDAPVLADHRAFGFDGVLPKPYRIEELVGLVRELLDGDRPDGHRTFAEAPEASRTGPEAS